MDSKTDILLVAINTKYQHSAFAARYLYANLDEELRPRAKILEFSINQDMREIAEKILSESPKIVGMSIYIWNTRQAHEIVSIIKRLSPKTIVVLGGPEVSHQTEWQAICKTADFTIRGEGDLLFPEFCREFLVNGKLPERKFISAELPDISKIASPYPYYSDEDIRNRIIYVEASRGCPFKCEYCLSSLDTKVRAFDTDRFLADLDGLIKRGARRFKFLDRTFNLNISTCRKILQFFLDRVELGLFIHFEMIPDRLPEELRDLLKKFPPGALQFEIGIQSWDPEVADRISRKQDYAKIRENFRFLREQTGVHTHADLIVGLPGETIGSFGAGFDALFGLGPDEIQVGVLKKLRGTPIARHDREWEMLYQEEAPYLVLGTKTMDFKTIQRLSRFSKFWDMIGNSGNFKTTVGFLKNLSAARADRSFFSFFMEMTDFLSERHPNAQWQGIALLNLVESIWVFLSRHSGADVERARLALLEDYAGRVKRDVPVFLRGATSGGKVVEAVSASLTSSHVPARQKRHLK